MVYLACFIQDLAIAVINITEKLELSNDSSKNSGDNFWLRALIFCFLQLCEYAFRKVADWRRYFMFLFVIWYCLFFEGLIIFLTCLWNVIEGMKDSLLGLFEIFGQTKDSFFARVWWGLIDRIYEIFIIFFKLLMLFDCLLDLLSLACLHTFVLVLMSFILYILAKKSLIFHSLIQSLHGYVFFVQILG